MPLKKTVRDKIMDCAITINRECPEECRDFRVMTSPLRPGVLILRWTAINIDYPEKPVQCFRFQCFEPDGSPQHCSVYYADQQEANAFFSGLRTLYRQTFAVDHKMK